MSESHFERSASRIRTRWIATFALGTSLVTFFSGFFVFLYMKSPAFENQLLGQMIQISGFGIILRKEIKK